MPNVFPAWGNYRESERNNRAGSTTRKPAISHFCGSAPSGRVPSTHSARAIWMHVVHVSQTLTTVFHDWAGLWTKSQRFTISSRSDIINMTHLCATREAAGKSISAQDAGSQDGIIE
jgi:hypothetical protein